MSDRTEHTFSDLDGEVEKAASLGIGGPSFSDILEDLYTDALIQQKLRRPVRKASELGDPALRHALDAAAKRMRELYTLDENWEYTRGIALIDKDTMALVGNFREYRHKTVKGTRKLVREHTPILVDASEIVEGYLGEVWKLKLHESGWTTEHSITCGLEFPQLMMEAPEAALSVKTKLGTLVHVVLINETQFATHSGNTLLRLPAGTDIIGQLGNDCKHAIKRACGL
jgi:hypothetical protein